MSALHTEPRELHPWPEAVVTTLQGASGHLTISEQTSLRCPVLFLITVLCEPLLTRRVSKIEIEKATQWAHRFDRNLHNTIEKETQERHQLCWSSLPLPPSWGQNKEDLVFHGALCSSGISHRGWEPPQMFVFRVRELILGNDAECTLLFTFVVGKILLISNIRIKHHLVV